MFKEAQEQVRRQYKTAGMEQYLPYLGLAAMLGGAAGGYHLLKPEPTIWQKAKRMGMRAYHQTMPALQQMGSALQQQAQYQQMLNAQMQGMGAQMPGMGIMPQAPQGAQGFIPDMSPLGGPIAPMDDMPKMNKEKPPLVDNSASTLGISPQELQNFSPNPQESFNAFL
jgi:hypothetical protein